MTYNYIYKGNKTKTHKPEAHLSQPVADENSQDAGGDAVSGRDLMGDDGSSSALEAFKALHHPERKAAERLLITDCLRQAESTHCCKVRQPRSEWLQMRSPPASIRSLSSAELSYACPDPHPKFRL